MTTNVVQAWIQDTLASYLDTGSISVASCCYGNREFRHEHRKCAKLPRENKVEQRPQLTQVVLHWCTGKDDSMGCAKLWRQKKVEVKNWYIIGKCTALLPQTLPFPSSCYTMIASHTSVQPPPLPQTLPFPKKRCHHKPVCKWEWSQHQDYGSCVPRLIWCNPIVEPISSQHSCAHQNMTSLWLHWLGKFSWPKIPGKRRN